MFELRVKDHFDAAHYIKGYPGPCSRLHGHRWDMEVCMQGGKLDELNMLMDFAVVKDLLKALLERVDHYLLNEQLNEDCVTAEYLARWMYDSLANFARKWGPNVKLVSVTVWESPEASITFRLDDSDGK